MPLIAPTLGPDGKPCPCSEGMSACSCGAQISVDCRARVGVAQLCGYPEFGTASVPPRRYRRKTFSGSGNGKAYAATDCATNLLGEGFLSAGGQNTYGRLNCQLTQGASATGDTGTVTGIESLPAGATGWGSYGSFKVTIVGRTETTWEFASVGQQVGACVVEGAASWKLEGTLKARLSEEDTEADAIARSNAQWTAWGGASCCSTRASRGANQLVFSFSEAQLRIKAKGAPGAEAKVRLVWQQQPLTGIGSVEQKTEMVSVVCDGSGVGELILAVPAATGMMVCLTEAKVIS